jgi:hypothetical protein
MLRRPWGGKQADDSIGALRSPIDRPRRKDDRQKADSLTGMTERKAKARAKALQVGWGGFPGLRIETWGTDNGTY